MNTRLGQGRVQRGAGSRRAGSSPRAGVLQRRAILFSMISVLLATFFILLFWNANAPRLERTTSAVETRVNVMDHYIGLWDSYVEDSLRFSTRGALIEIATQLEGKSYAVSKSQMTGNLSRCLEEGTFNPAGSDVSCSPGGVSETFESRLNNFTRLASDELGITTTYGVSQEYTIKDWSPFEIMVSFVMNYTVGDGFAQWNRSVRHDVVVSVVGVPDPLFARYGSTLTLGGQPWHRNITKFPVPRELLTQHNLSSMIANASYVNNRGMGPTFLERLAGKITGSLDSDNRSGIETLMDPADIGVILLPSLSNYSHVAHQLFAHEVFLCGNETLGINSAAGGFAYPHFRLDIPHIARFNMNNVTFWNQTCY